MKKLNLYLLIDVLMAFFLALIAGLGIMIKYILVAGTKRWEIYDRNVDLSFLGLDRHQWGTVHLVIAILFFLLLIIHIYLHWKILMGHVKTIIAYENIRERWIIAFFFVIFVFIAFPFIIKVKVEEMGDGRDRFIHETERKWGENAGSETQFMPSQVLESEKELKKAPDEDIAEIEHHEIDPDIEVLGSMSLSQVSQRYDIPITQLRDKLGLPSYVSGTGQLGQLKRIYGFKMSEIELIIHNYRNR